MCMTLAASILVGVLLAPAAQCCGAQHPPELPVDSFQVRGSSGPLIVLEAGMGETSETWAGVAGALAERYRIFTYDRRGLGNSPPAASKRDARQLAIELRSALRQANVDPPYILVGHSLGGLVVILFAEMYPQETAGLLLEDLAWNERELKLRLTPAVWNAREAAIAQYSREIPDGVRREKESLQESIDQASAAKLPNVPAMILTGTKFSPSFPGAEEEKALKLEEHTARAARLPLSRHVLVPSSRHYIHVDEPAVFTQAVADLAAKVATRSLAHPATP
jgi:pimeloyl-ACP methyl ester carboxylesterase